ncbi:MAG: hypothetical protein VR69_15080 [Peptococcaceae bacterium BRH_c4b]|nr:MAG: hypothetical protein VR69_15080 [Peptococcaceae bacterium BRH_c4b]
MLKFILFLMQSLPESSGMIAFSLALVRVKLRWGIILAAGLVSTLIIYFIRELPVAFGLHTVVSMLLMAVFISKATKVLPSRSFAAVFACFALLALLEAIMYEATARLLNREIKDIMSDYLLWRITGLPQALLMNIAAVLMSRYRKPMEGMWKI